MQGDVEGNCVTSADFSRRENLKETLSTKDNRRINRLAICIQKLLTPIGQRRTATHHKFHSHKALPHTGWPHRAKYKQMPTASQIWCGSPYKICCQTIGILHQILTPDQNDCNSTLCGQPVRGSIHTVACAVPCHCVPGIFFSLAAVLSHFSETNEPLANGCGQKSGIGRQSHTLKIFLFSRIC